MKRTWAGKLKTTLVSPSHLGNIAQNHPLPVLNEDDLAAATTRLTGNAYLDWQLKNKIVDIEIKKT